MAAKPNGFTANASGYFRDSDNAGPFFWDGSNMIPVAGQGRFGFLPAGTSRSGVITTGGTAQQLAAANTSRTSLKGQNISTGDLWINEIDGTATSAAPDAQKSFRVPAGATFSISTNRLISVYGATTGQAWTAIET